MKVARRTAETSLKKKGFREDRSRNHPYFFHQVNGKETGIKTYVSHSPGFKDIGGDILRSMRSQLRLDTVKQVTDFLNCPMSEEQYLEILVQKGLLPS